MEDVLGFAAFGGLERVAIIGGALLVGYWGFRLYLSGKPAGLAFLGISCVMLFGALLTGGSHVRSVGESIQLASSRAPEPVTDSAPGPVADSPGAEDRAPQSSLDTPSASPTAELGAAAGSADTIEQSAAAIDGGTLELAAITDTEPDVLDSQRSEGVAARGDRLPTAQELGGRIVSVKSGNLSLEWSPAPTDQ